MPAETTFILNHDTISTTESPGTLVLDYLRRKQKLVGTKEGCKEGDCGACVVLVGELTGASVSYKPVTSCLMPLGELHGKHLVTIEALRLDQLTPVQQAIVDEGGSQCGFCTPGIVMSLTGYLLQPAGGLDDAGIKYALGGNLCRCTGYGSLKRAGGQILQEVDAGSAGSGQDRVSNLIAQQVVPDYFSQIPARLRSIPPIQRGNGAAQSAYIIAGGTDLYVQRGGEIPYTEVEILNRRQELRGISVEGEHVRVGALTTFEEFAQNTDIQKIIPRIGEYMMRNASWQIRNRATLGGNIVNASPIGDMTALLLALDTTLTLEDGLKKRNVALRSFFKGYKQLDKTPAEVLTEIMFSVPDSGTRVHFEKVSKRKTLDIASVNSAIRIKTASGKIVRADLSFGGVAPIPLFMQNTCDFLAGKQIEMKTVLAAIDVAHSESAPISDIRGSADYKRLLVRQLLIAHFTTLFPDQLTVKDFYETH